ncbi:MAG: 3-dehydroquinate synthase [Bacteroides sp.]|nr:3-dehydroquinate synthase [Bacteroides sp.]MCM1378975.1 3-dehydroquinate synthase [Bacteroides sp.]MCM1445591.1 3-dehydroquinate synthase [Prevotella sp.]
MQKLIFSNNVAEELSQLIAEMAPGKVFFLTDDNTRPIALELGAVNIITIPAGDENKNLDSLAEVWRELSENGATRRSLLVNVGGGMVTDLGGFAAATFKRGIRFINVATTLLGAVDAAVGGKTGINFHHFKNEIGAFAPAEAVIISTRFFSTLPSAELRSGFAEMLKHGLISSADTYHRLLSFDIVNADLEAMLPLLEENVLVKRRIVDQDPREQGIRKALNLGHTAGHALESMAMERNHPVTHGYAVAHGLLIEMILSHMLEGFPSAELYPYAALLKEAYANFPPVDCNDYPRLLELMSHDKKNSAPDRINFTLLKAPGNPLIDQIVPAKEIQNALDIYRDLL